jgi:predicted transcriptional regulator
MTPRRQRAEQRDHAGQPRGLGFGGLVLVSACHLARAPFRASFWRCLGVRAAIRTLPPLRPPNRPSAPAAGFLPSERSIGCSAPPVAWAMIAEAISLTSRDFLERLGIRGSMPSYAGRATRWGMAGHSVHGVSVVVAEPRTVSVAFPGEVYKTLEELATATGRTMGQVLVDAINREKWYQDTVKSGGRLLVQRGELAYNVSSGG